ncbi:MAG: SGNH/GDSL hydrolase family protein [Gammaproteobacteria bacterium]|nr:SGNH/GDSL hydrolase family protein [Gammaproteobacteria bacterium]
MKKIIALVLSLFVCSSVFAANIKQVVFFGDSMTDNGNLYNLIKTMPKSPPYYKGRFTNGPTWAEYVERSYYNNHYIDSQNYAYGGATAILHSFVTDKIALPITLSAEMYEYYLNTLYSDKTDVLYSIWIGANDYLFETEPDLDGLTTNVTNSISDAVKELIGKGAKNFLIINLPDLASTPYAVANGTTERLHTLTLLHNKKLADAVINLRNDNPGVTIAFLNLYDEFTGLVTNTAQYNQTYGLSIKDTTDACWLGGETLKEIHSSPYKENQLNAEISGELSKNMKGGKQFDTKTISHYILNSPDIYAAYSVSKAHSEGMQPCDNPNEHIFWDDVHPTAQIHEVVGKLAIEALGKWGLTLR